MADKKKAPAARSAKSTAAAGRKVGRKPTAAKKPGRSEAKLVAKKPVAKVLSAVKAKKPVAKTAGTSAAVKLPGKPVLKVAHKAVAAKPGAAPVRAVAAAMKPAGQKITAPVPPQHQMTPKAVAEKAAAARQLMTAQKKPVNQRHGFKASEFIVYPAHGVGKIVGIEEQEIAGMALELFVINFEKEKLTLRVPTGKLAERRHAQEGDVRRSGTRDRYLLATGHGAALAREAGDVNTEYIVALDVVAADREGISEARIRSASPVEREWIQPTSTAIEHGFDLRKRPRARSARRGVRRHRAQRSAEYDPVQCGSATSCPGMARPRTRRDDRTAPAAAADLLRSTWTCPGSLARPLRQPKQCVDIDLKAHLPFDVKRVLASRAPASMVRAERSQHDARVRRRWLGLGVSEAAGTVRAGGVADRRNGPRVRDVSSARAKWPAGADEARPSQLLGEDLYRRR